jgi:exopolysaccharide biosynthesis protein
MTVPPRCAWLLLLVGASAVAGDWEPVVAGVDYLHLQRTGLDAHVVRVDLDVRSLEVVTTAAAERGLTVSEFARGRSAIVAVNGDYFDPSLNPFGLAMGDGTVWWQAVAGVRRQEVLGVGPGRARIFPRAEPLRTPKRWMTGAVAGWPAVVEDCAPVATLPGSAHFTLAPHPRTAAGLSKDRRELLLVVADGRREGVPGLTLPELAALLVEVGACTALNLDGGGSSALWLRDRIVNQPSDGLERKVANHLGVAEARRTR